MDNVHMPSLDRIEAGAPGIILEFLRWLDSKSICLAGAGGAGDLVECGRSHSELVAEFMSRGDRSPHAKC